MLISSIGLLLVAYSISTCYDYMKPRMPSYVMKPLLSKIPKLKYVVNEWKTEIATQIDLFNENYIHLDIHAITFDLLAVDTIGIVRHIGTITDQQQSELHILSHYDKKKEANREQQQQQQQQQYPLNYYNNNATKQQLISQTTSKDRRITKRKPEVLWSVGGRTRFTDTASIHISISSMRNVLNSITALLKRWWYGYGIVVLPTTGVVQLSARSKSSSTATKNAIPSIPITISLICDNEWNTWTMQISGLECIIHEMKPGWLNITKTTETVRNHALTKLLVNSETGSILSSSSSSREGLTKQQQTGSTTTTTTTISDQIIKSIAAEQKRL